MRDIPTATWPRAQETWGNFCVTSPAARAMLYLMKLDQADRRILQLLQRNSRLSIAEIAEEVGLSASACHRRIKLLEESGIIAGYVARLNPKKLGYQIEVFVAVSLASQSEDSLERFERAIRDTVEILECHLMAGTADYILRVAVRDPAHYAEIHREKLSRLPGVSRLETNFTLQTILKRHGYKLPE